MRVRRGIDPQWCSRVHGVERVAGDEWRVLHKPLKLQRAPYELRMWRATSARSRA